MTKHHVVLAAVSLPIVAGLLVTSIFFSEQHSTRMPIEEFSKFEHTAPAFVRFTDFVTKNVTFSCLMLQADARKLVRDNNKVGTDLIADDSLISANDPDFEVAMQAKGDRICPYKK